MRSMGIVALALILSPALGNRARPRRGRGRSSTGPSRLPAARIGSGDFKAAEWTCKGTAHASTDLAFTDHCFAQWPEQFRNESAVEGGGQKFERTLILDDSQGWIKMEKDAVVMNDAARDEFRDKVHVLCLSATLLPLKDKSVTLKPLDEIKIDGRAAAGVSATSPGRPEVVPVLRQGEGPAAQVRAHRQGSAARQGHGGDVFQRLPGSGRRAGGAEGVREARRKTVPRLDGQRLPGAGEIGPGVFAAP